MVRPKILIIEDDPLELTLFSEFCEGQEWDVITANDGEAGYAILQKEMIDLAIVDLCLPKMNGLTFLKQAKQEKIQTPIVIMSGQGSLERGVDAIRAGAVDVWDKPFTRADFFENVQTYLRLRVSWAIRLGAFLIDNCHNSELKFEDLTRHFRFSKTYGSALFKKHLGKTFRMYLREVRLNKAITLMDTDLTLSEIAHSCGFASLANFSKVFKLEYQCNPSDYRKKVNIRTSIERNDKLSILKTNPDSDYTNIT